MSKHVRVALVGEGETERVVTMLCAPVGVMRYALREEGHDPDAVRIVPLGSLERTRRGRALIDAYLTRRRTFEIPRI